MAVYNVEAVNEALNNNESILDSLEEACDYMLSVLDEGAQKDAYVNTKRQKSREDYNKQEERDNGRYASDNVYHKNVRDAEIKPGKFSAYDKQRHYNKMKENGIKASELVNKDKDNRDFEHEWGDYRRQTLNHERQIRYANDAAARHLRKTEKKKAIKETCLHILSILDDIE